MSYRITLIAILALLLAACGSAPAAPTALVESTLPALPTETTAAPSPTATIEPTLPTATLPASTITPAVDLKTHTDMESGFSFDYPAAWMLDAVSLGSRAPTGYQLTSWPHEPGMVSDVPAGGTIMNIIIQLWDPKADLAAYVDMRKMALEGSGITILSETDLTLANGASAKEIITESADGQGYFLFSTLGENYLVASGNGDLELIGLVARSLR